MPPSGVGRSRRLVVAALGSPAGVPRKARRLRERPPRRFPQAARRYRDLPSGIRHKRQQEACGNHKAKECHDQRQNCGDAARPRRDDAIPAIAEPGACRPSRCSACPTPQSRRDRTQGELHAALPRQERPQATIGGRDRNQDRQESPSGVMRHREIAGQPMHADIVHAGDADPSSTAEDTTRNRRLTDADEEQ